MRILTAGIGISNRAGKVGFHFPADPKEQQSDKPTAKDHGVDLDGSMATKEFLELAKNSYGRDIIKRTIKAYEGEK